NGNVNDPIGITITGERNVPGVVGSTSFVMRVRYDGMMLWKVNYPLTTPTGVVPNDEGWDIMFEAEAVGIAGTVDNFVVTGLSNATGTGATPGCLGFLSRVNVNTGAFVNAHRFGVPGSTLPPNPLTYGQGIYQARVVAQNVVITGGVDDPNSGLTSDTYLLEMDITNGTIFNAHHYTLTSPNFPRTESVVSVGSGYPTPGYFISTNSLNTYGGATLSDGHVIKTNGLGMVNPTTCHSDTLKPVFDTVKSNPIQYCTDQVCDNFVQHQLVMKKKTAQHVLCFSTFKLEDGIDAFLELGENEIGVFPNPVSNNENINLFFTAANAGRYTIQVLDINGRVVKNISQYFEAGDQQLAIETATLTEGMYFISLSDGASAVSTKFIRLK
ncbi:MAG: T9SS type A sorting domain-containing protein, partial [Chitinophagales bacterium]